MTIEQTFKREKYAAVNMVTEEALALSAGDLRKFVKEDITRELRRLGATSDVEWIETPQTLSIERPRAWWQRLLRRPAETDFIRMRQFMGVAYGLVPDDS